MGSSNRYLVEDMARTLEKAEHRKEPNIQKIKIIKYNS